MSADQEDVSVHETAMRLLGHLQRLKACTIDELQGCVDWLVLWLSFERDVLERDQVDLERIQLFPVKVGQERLLAANREV